MATPVKTLPCSPTLKQVSQCPKDDYSIFHGLFSPQALQAHGPPYVGAEGIH